MENQVLTAKELIEVTHESAEGEMRELSQLQLAVIGGGCAEVCPY